MADMLVKLYDLPQLAPALHALAVQGITVRRAQSHERAQLSAWVAAHFSPGWASECQAAFSRQPVSCFLAVERLPAEGPGYRQAPEVLLGFACYEVTCKNFFGPEGVAERYRGRGVGKGLLLACLHAMAAEGYAYAIIGWAGPVAFYQRTVGAELIAGSEPGIFAGPLAEG